MILEKVRCRCDLRVGGLLGRLGSTVQTARWERCRLGRRSFPGKGIAQYANSNCKRSPRNRSPGNDLRGAKGIGVAACVVELVQRDDNKADPSAKRDRHYSLSEVGHDESDRRPSGLAAEIGEQHGNRGVENLVSRRAE